MSEIIQNISEIIFMGWYVCRQIVRLPFAGTFILWRANAEENKKSLFLS